MLKKIIIRFKIMSCHYFQTNGYNRPPLKPRRFLQVNSAQTCLTHDFSLPVRDIVAFIKLLPGVPVMTNRAQPAHHLDIIPGKINLHRFKTAPGAFREQMMVVMPFARNNTRPKLVDRFIVIIIIVFSFCLSFPLACPS
jgi:hypothetical protein